MSDERPVRVGRIEGTRGREKVIFFGGKICFGEGEKLVMARGWKGKEFRGGGWGV